MCYRMSAVTTVAIALLTVTTTISAMPTEGTITDSLQVQSAAFENVSDTASRNDTANHSSVLSEHDSEVRAVVCLIL
ncbi:unnamed protein product [Gongylonema pulchrum]|uniref:Secreted protein n=1 Tax=Gongylonema pulchrum TaxID=637853 RepID=A0A183CXD8_9BILA|nr:unnamed protein product [Gongylonema pulchrum]